MQPLNRPIRVVTRHRAHAELLKDQPKLRVWQEPAPWAGPLQALARVLPATSDQALLVMPVDMPRLSTPVLRQLIAAWQVQPDRVAVAHDGQRLQPLLAVIPSGSPFQSVLIEQVEAGRLRWIDGPLTGIAHSIVDAQENTVTLADPLLPEVQPGRRVLLREGCDRTLATCADRFGNALNFRGEPFLPGNDMMARYPVPR